jgi:hypothetical protein
MTKISKVTSYVLAALAGVCFVTGVALLTDEGSAMKNGLREETNIDA